MSVRLGNAVDTLRDPGGIVDMMFLDGYPELYLTIVRGALPYLRSGTVIVADNVYTHRRVLRAYRRFVRAQRVQLHHASHEVWRGVLGQTLDLSVLYSSPQPTCVFGLSSVSIRSPDARSG